MCRLVFKRDSVGSSVVIGTQDTEEAVFFCHSFPHNQIRVLIMGLKEALVNSDLLKAETF